jgi:hypothetical protein
MASSLSQRQTVLSLIVATRPEFRTLAASSAVLHRDKGVPVHAGNSHASALTCTTISGGKSPGTARAGEFVQTPQALLKEPLAPQPHNFATGVKAAGDFIIVDPFCGEKNHPGALNLKEW